MGASARNGLMPIFRKMFLINFLYLHLHLSQPRYNVAGFISEGSMKLEH